MSACLALEWSSPVLSVALDAGGTRWERSEQPDRFRASLAYDLIRAVLADAACPASRIDGLCIGRGPGNYSGMRVALAWAAGFAAPGGIGTVALSSARAQAWRLWRQHPGPLRILGDARRDCWWGLVIQGEADFATPEPVWSVLPTAAWARNGPPGPSYSAESSRLAGLAGVIQDVPTAGDLLDFHAAFPERREEPLPLYPHPPVQAADQSPR